MAITSLAAANTGLMYPVVPFFKQKVSANNEKWYSSWGIGGNPAAGSFDTTLNGVTLSSSSSQVAGQLRFQDPASGNCYLQRLDVSLAPSGTATAGGSNTGQTQSLFLTLCDRLWHNGGFTITSTSAQSITSPTWPARDIAGSTNGDGVMLGLEMSSSAGAGAPTITVSYTNSAGTSGRTGTNVFTNGILNAVASQFFPIGLQAGDTGVQSVQSLTLSASWVTGTMNLVAYRPIAILDIQAQCSKYILDPLNGALPQMFNGSVPFFIFQTPSGGGAGDTYSITGHLQYTSG